MLFGVIILLCIYLFGGYWLSKRSIFAPCVLTTAVWLFCLFLFVVLTHSLPPLSKKFLGCLSFWASGLVVSSLLIQSFRFPTIQSQASCWIRDLYLIVVACSIVFLLGWAMNIITHSAGAWQGDLRMAAIGDSRRHDPFNGFLVIVCQVSYALELYYFSFRKWWRLALPCAFMLLFAFFSFSKIVFFWLFVLTVCVLYFKHYIKVKHILIGVLALFVTFFALQSIRSGMEFDTEEKKTGFVVLYALSSMSAFDVTIPKSSIHFGENTFRPVYAISYKLGLSSVQPVDPLLPFISKPIKTNTYTGMYPFYKDFGIWGVIIASLFSGLLYGFVFKGAQSGSSFFVILYAYVAVIIVQQYVSDALMTNLTGHIKFVLLLLLPFFVNKYKILRA